MSDQPKIADDWREQDDARRAILDKAIDCASYVKPWVCPPRDHTEVQEMEQTFTSLPGRGVSNVEGKMQLALFPVGTPFYQMKPAASIRYDPRNNPSQVQAYANALSLYELMLMAKFESADVGNPSNRNRAGFRSRKRQAITQILVTGDCLEQLTDDYRLRVFRRDQYVTLRDSSQDVISHIVKEKIDPLSLPHHVLMKADLPSDLLEKPIAKRMVDILTRVQWQPLTKSWLIEQEINKNLVNESGEVVSPFFATPYELAPGENYGRGFVEYNFADIRSFNELRERLLDFAGMASKFVPVIDENSGLRASDLGKASGVPIIGKVIGGQIQDVAFLSTNKTSDFQVVFQTSTQVRTDLAVAMLMESESTPTGDRVTAFQVQRMAQELEGALGGVFTSIADYQQVPLVERGMWQMTRDRLLPPLPRQSVEIEALTGLAAMSRENDKDRILQFVATMSQFGESGMNRLNIGVLFDKLLRDSAIFEPGLIKTDAQLSAEASAAMQQQVELAAKQQLIKTGGAVMENSLAQNGQQQAA